MSRRDLFVSNYFSKCSLSEVLEYLHDRRSGAGEDEGEGEGVQVEEQGDGYGKV